MYLASLSRSPFEKKTGAGASKKNKKIGSRSSTNYAALVLAPRRYKAKGNCTFGAALKKIPGAGAAWEEIRSRKSQ